MGIRWFGDRIKRETDLAVDRALDDAAEFLLEDANRTIPHLTGFMAGTGATSDLGEHRRAVFYDTPYAVRQHEDTRLRHAPGRRARWLALTFQENGDKVRDFLASRIKGGL